VVYIAAGWGVYFVVMGALLRRLARRWPLPLASALAWTSVEVLRSWIEPPFGLSWFRLGHYAHDDLWLAGSSRVLGVAGLSFVLAALAGALVDLARGRRCAGAAWLAAALGPLAVAAVLALVVRAPATTEGPRVLLVQPGFEQARKQYGDPDLNFADSTRLTLAALEAQAQRGEATPDLVVWGESMLNVVLLAEDLPEALRRGAQLPDWKPPLDESRVLSERARERHFLGRELLAALPEGVSFAAGVEYYQAAGARILGRVALVLYDDQGRRSAPAFKRHLVPLGETMFGLERFAWVRRMALSAAGYLPDFVPGEETGLLTLETRSGRRYRMSGTVCFDNAFLDSYVDGARAGADLHLVSSNEAWYRDSCEMDQMIAFSRLIALSTGRSIVRATNSGISAVLAPDGRELGRVLDASGRDRAVAGSGAWTVPVPAPGSGTTPFVRLFRWLRPLWILLAGLAALRPAREPGSGRPGAEHAR